MFRRLRLARHQGLLIAIAAFATLFLTVDLISPGPVSYFEISFMSSGGATLALAAVGETLVILSGGFDLSAGAVISLVNVVLADNMDPADMEASVVLWTLIGVGIGMLAGAFNGFFVAFLRLQPIVVTLSTMFILQGAAPDFTLPAHDGSQVKIGDYKGKKNVVLHWYRQDFTGG